MIYNAVLPGKGARTVPRVQKMETKRVAHLYRDFARLKMIDSKARAECLC